jgi:hypothetical protein
MVRVLVPLNVKLKKFVWSEIIHDICPQISQHRLIISDGSGNLCQYHGNVYIFRIIFFLTKYLYNF